MQLSERHKIILVRCLWCLHIADSAMSLLCLDQGKHFCRSSTPSFATSSVGCLVISVRCGSVLILLRIAVDRSDCFRSFCSYELVCVQTSRLNVAKYRMVELFLLDLTSESELLACYLFQKKKRMFKKLAAIEFHMFSYSVPLQ